MRSLIQSLRRHKLPKSDPAPSRLKYRIQRWMLTPGIRLGLRVGLPICCLGAALAIFLASEERRDVIVTSFNELRTEFENRPEFLVNVMAIDGAGSELSDDIREVMSIDFPVSSFDLELPMLRDLIEGLDPVKSAKVRIRPGGILQVDVVERTPAVVWRTRDGLALLDETGAFVAELGSRDLHPLLPLIVGTGADAHVPEALQLLAASRPLDGRVRGLVRIGERRWDVVLDRDQRILLPTLEPVTAFERVIAVSEVQELLERDVAIVDMRLSQRPTVRMTENAVENWWQIKELNAGNR